MKKFTVLAITTVLLIISSPVTMADDIKEIRKTFDTEKKLKLDLVLGGCTIKASDDQKVHLLVKYNYDEQEFEVKISERTRSINIEEKLSNNPSGFSEWTLFVPKKAEIEFNSATGSLSMENIVVDIEASSGTGSIEVMNCQGDFELSSGTGSIEVTNSQGEFDLGSGTGKVVVSESKGNIEAGSGTGRVKANHVEISDEGDFSSGTGSVEIKDITGKSFDLTASSGTGNATLIMNKSNLKGYFEFSANANHGRIDSPIDFDGEEIIDTGSERQLRKWFQKDKDTPRYYIKTGTGKAALEL